MRRNVVLWVALLGACGSNEPAGSASGTGTTGSTDSTGSTSSTGSTGTPGTTGGILTCNDSLDCPPEAPHCIDDKEYGRQCHAACWEPHPFLFCVDDASCCGTQTCDQESGQCVGGGSDTGTSTGTG